MSSFGHQCSRIFKSDAFRSMVDGKFPYGFWKNPENLDKVVSIILTKRKSAFLFDLKNDPMTDLQPSFIGAFGVGLSGPKLLGSMQRFRSEWAEALSRAGHPRDAKELNQSRVIEVILWLNETSKKQKKKTKPLSVSEVLSNETPEFLAFLKTTFEIEMTGSAFVQKVRRAFGSWSKALKAANLKADLMSQKSPRLNEQEVRVVLVGLKGDKTIDWASVDFRENHSDSYRSIIQGLIGRPLTLSQVFRSAIEVKSWGEWQKELFEDYRTVSKGNIELSESEIIAVLRAASEKEFLLNKESIVSDKSKAGAQLVFETIGLSLSLQRIFNHALSRTIPRRRKWVEWLSLAGLDVTKIQLSGRIPYELVNEVTRASLREVIENQEALLGSVNEFVREYDANGNGQNIQVDRVTPEKQLMEKEFNQRFQEFSGELSRREALLLEVLIDQLSTGIDIHRLLTEPIKVKDISFEASEITDLLVKIKNNPYFIEMFFSEG